MRKDFTYATIEKNSILSMCTGASMHSHKQVNPAPNPLVLKGSNVVNISTRTNVLLASHLRGNPRQHLDNVSDIGYRPRLYKKTDFTHLHS